MKRFVLNYWNGAECYEWFDSIQGVNKWREDTGFNGILYTADGHLVDEEKKEND